MVVFEVYGVVLRTSSTSCVTISIPGAPPESVWPRAYGVEDEMVQTSRWHTPKSHYLHDFSRVCA